MHKHAFLSLSLTHTHTHYKDPQGELGERSTNTDLQRICSAIVSNELFRTDNDNSIQCIIAGVFGVRCVYGGSCPAV